MSRKYFGTDGIRGRVGEGAISAEFVLHLGWAVGKVFAREGRSSVLIGKDTRISGYMFESALQAGLSAAGVDVRLLGPMPTPAIAYLTRIFRAQAGIVISASHNAYHDNGIKFFSAQGTKLPDSVEHAIESKMDSPIETVDSADLGKASRIPDASGRYIEFCKSTVAMGLDLSGMRIGLDCANGATYHIAPAVLEELGATVKCIGIEPNGVNINHQCGSTYPQALKELVLAEKLDLGIALDGDGDRLIMVDQHGEEVDGDELLFIIARDKKEQAKLTGGVVGTVMSNLGLELALADLEIPFARAKVGDRYVMELLQQREWMLGGESSGHILCLDAASTGDGIVSALQVLAAMARTELSLADLKQGIQKLPQRMINVPLAEKYQAAPEVLTKEVLRVEKALADRGRVLLRPSGTEPVLRVMVEGEDKPSVMQYAQEIADVAREALA